MFLTPIRLHESVPNQVKLLLTLYSLINFVKLASVVSLDIKLLEQTRNQRRPPSTVEPWLIFM